MMKKSALMILLIVVLWGCTGPAEQIPADTQEQPEAPTTPAQAETGDTSVDDVTSSISEIEALDEELDDSELAEIEKELADIDW